MHAWLDRIFEELDPDQHPYALGVAVECGDEAMLVSIADGDEKPRKAVLTAEDEVAAAFAAGTVNVGSEDVPS
jgi:hypothetical protein